MGLTKWELKQAFVTMIWPYTTCNIVRMPLNYYNFCMQLHFIWFFKVNSSSHITSVLFIIFPNAVRFPKIYDMQEGAIWWPLTSNQVISRVVSYARFVQTSKCRTYKKNAKKSHRRKISHCMYNITCIPRTYIEYHTISQFWWWSRSF